MNRGQRLSELEHLKRASQQAENLSPNCSTSELLLRHDSNNEIAGLIVRGEFYVSTSEITRPPISVNRLNRPACRKLSRS